MKTQLYWHIHHEVLYEVATEPIKRRREFIKVDKAPSERATRLRLLKPIPTRLLPPSILRLIKLHDELEAKKEKVIQQRKKLELQMDALLVKEDKLYDRARDTRNLLHTRENKEKMEALHKKLCKKCPWDGQTIFPYKPTQDV